MNEKYSERRTKTKCTRAQCLCATKYDWIFFAELLSSVFKFNCFTFCASSILFHIRIKRIEQIYTLSLYRLIFCFFFFVRASESNPFLNFQNKSMPNKSCMMYMYKMKEIGNDVMIAVHFQFLIQASFNSYMLCIKSN